MVSDFKKAGEELPFPLREEWTIYKEVLRNLEGYETGAVPSTILVKHSTYFFVNDKNELLGFSNIRHELNDSLMNEGGHINYAIRPSQRNKGLGTKILELSLIEARKMGIDKVLLNCETNNVASEKIFLKNGAVFWKEYELNGKRVRGYWVEN